MLVSYELKRKGNHEFRKSEKQSHNLIKKRLFTPCGLSYEASPHR